MKPKFKKGDMVTIARVFTPVVAADGTNYDYSHGRIIVEVIESRKSSMGYCYQLSHPTIFLGGVMYWEDEICSIEDPSEDAFWRMWGDH
mgnify:CR=1 FL=1|jgi:hypothetical protein